MKLWRRWGTAEGVSGAGAHARGCLQLMPASAGPQSRSLQLCGIKLVLPTTLSARWQRGFEPIHLIWAGASMQPHVGAAEPALPWAVPCGVTGLPHASSRGGRRPRLRSAGLSRERGGKQRTRWRRAGRRCRRRGERGTGRAGRAGGAAAPSGCGERAGLRSLPLLSGAALLPAGCHFTSALPGPGAAALPRTVPGRGGTGPGLAGLARGTGRAPWTGRCSCSAAGDPCGVPSARDGVRSLREKQGLTHSKGISSGAGASWQVRVFSSPSRYGC